MSNYNKPQEKQQETETFKLSDYEPTQIMKDITIASNTFSYINFNLEEPSDQVFEYLEDHLDEHELNELEYDFLELKLLVDYAWDNYKKQCICFLTHT